jgi:hypothetical protein
LSGAHEGCEFITLLGGAATWPLAALAQHLDRVLRIGVLMGFAESDSLR